MIPSESSDLYKRMKNNKKDKYVDKTKDCFCLHTHTYMYLSLKRINYLEFIYSNTPWDLNTW